MEAKQRMTRCARAEASNRGGWAGRKGRGKFQERARQTRSEDLVTGVRHKGQGIGRESATSAADGALF